MDYIVWETCLFVPGLKRADCAAWVQAWGSIGAILAAVVVAYRSAKHSENLLERQRQDRLIDLFVAPLAVTEAYLKAAGAFYTGAAIAINGKAEAPPPPRPPAESYVPRRELQNLQLVTHSFAKIEPTVMPSAPAVDILLRLQVAVRDVQSTANAVEHWLLHNWGAFDLQQLHEKIQAVHALREELVTESVRLPNA